ncbi:MAG: GH3 auxin-responsive promoter family protein, partial [Gammaproteobacteria bacterium]|nr:GH3 auxin-responsive promoter family protein [Gammaproteobacteria bacterium]
LVHGGVSMTPYRKRFSDFLDGSRCDLREIYATSEGFLAIADRQPGEGLRLICDHGIFYEFVPFDEFHQANPTRCWIGNVQTGVDYAIVLSTCAGLWSYILGDVVQFVDLNPPRLLITGRTANTLSIFGEKVLEEQISQAVTTAAAAIGVIVSEFTVGASHPQNAGEQGKYRYILEFQDDPPVQEDLHRFTETLEQTLRQNNGLYDAVQ